ncbi:CaiB/BaiF CoA transferase family protein [Propylenella binzhouense]|uniref:CoA transferase n=1 Tax=Propylenella binzhouense TaxID=2555902 RepID=A0A964WSE4_9HYPH|nr:CoA transferase [Propylenella binzhouense]MYZ46893.1 CoA transferase [Propylenella binzhouense]
MSELGGFLRGVRVLDLSQYIPGPMASLFLADMGAEVLKIEPPQGDEMQRLGPRDAEGRPVFYGTMNAGKTVMRMNLKDDATRALFLEMVCDADVVIEGFRPGVMKRLGIDYPVLKRANPAIILCSISGYGTNASQRSMAGHDANYLAMMGVLDRNGGDSPAFFDPPVSDVAGSLFAAMIILGALHGRNRTGGGCEIDLALADTVMPLQMMQVADHGANGTVPKRGTTYLNGGAAYYQVYRTGDGRFAVLAAVEPKFWRAFCGAAGRPDWIARHDDSFPQQALRQEVQDFFSRIDSAEAADRFGSVDCCFTLVKDLGEALAGKQVDERRLVRRGPAGDLQALLPVWINGEPPASRPATVVAGNSETANGEYARRASALAGGEPAAESDEARGKSWP